MPTPRALATIDRSAVGPDLSSYRHLALTVIERALRDLPDGACSLTDRESARRFFVGSAIMRHWCRVAGLDPYRVIAHARRLR